MMLNQWFNFAWHVGLVGLLGGGGAVAFTNATFAQSVIVPDNTLGNERSQVIQNFRGLPIEVIAGGAVRG